MAEKRDDRDREKQTPGKSPPPLPRPEDEVELDAVEIVEHDTPPPTKKPEPPKPPRKVTQLAKPSDAESDAPNLSLDEDKWSKVSRTPSMTIEVSPLFDEPGPSALAGEPVPPPELPKPESDVMDVEAIVIPDSDVVEAEAILSDSAVMPTEIVEDVAAIPGGAGTPDSSVILAEAPSERRISNDASAPDSAVLLADDVEIPADSGIISAEILADDALTSSAARRQIDSEDALLDAEDTSMLPKPDSAIAVKGGRPDSDIFGAAFDSAIESKSASAQTSAETMDQDALVEEVTEEADIDWGNVKGPASGAVSVGDQTIAFDHLSHASDEVESTQAFRGDDEVDLGQFSKSSSSSASSLSSASTSGTGIDRVAEQLESGIDVRPGAKRPATPSVEFDDLITEDLLHDDGAGKPDGHITEESDLMGRVSDQPKDETDMARFLDDAPSTTKKKSKKAIAAQDDDDLVAAAVDDEDEAVAAVVEDEEPKPKPKVKRKPQPAMATSGGGKGGWLGGTVLGLVLGVAGVAGTGFVAPDLIKEGLKLSPSYKEPERPLAPPPGPQLTLSQKARTELESGNFDQAIALLKDSDKGNPAEMALRGEARLRKYAKELVDRKATFDKESPDVKQALADLQDGGDAYLIEQANRLSQDKDLRDAATAAAKAQDSLTKLVEIAKLPKGASADELPKKFGEIVKSREDLDQLVQGITETLVKTKQLEEGAKLDAETAKKTLEDAGAGKASLAAVNKILEDAKLKDSGEKGVLALVTVKKELDEKWAELQKILVEEKVKEAGAKGVQEIVEGRNKTRKDQVELEAVVKAVAGELAKAKLLPADADPRKGLVQAAKKALEKAESPLGSAVEFIASGFSTVSNGLTEAFKGVGSNTALATEVGYLRAREPFVWTPKTKLDANLMLVLDRNRTEADLLKQIQKETDFVLKSEAVKSPEIRGKANLVLAMVQRNAGNFDQARVSFDASIKDLLAGPATAKLAKQAQDWRNEIVDPNTYYLPRAEKALAERRYGDALREIQEGLKAMPGNGTLQAREGMVLLELARSTSTPIAKVENAVRNAANAAAANAPAESAYMLGILESELGNGSKAEEHLRKALAAGKLSPQQEARVRVALAKILLQQSALDPAPTPEPVLKTSARSSASDGSGNQLHIASLSGWFLLQAIKAQPGFGDAADVSPGERARIEESLKLAKSLLDLAENSKDLDARQREQIKAQALMIQGKALTKQGRHTEGVMLYTEGLKILNKNDESAKELTQLLSKHPGLQPAGESADGGADPVKADLFYNQGLTAYWNVDHRRAEQMFQKAVQAYSLDARYYYWLGLSQLAQQTREKRDFSAVNFERGAKLETANRPTMTEINASLERVQGELRQYINTFRPQTIAGRRR